MLTGQIHIEMLRAFRNKKFIFLTLLFPVVLYILLTKTLGGNSLNGIAFSVYYLVSMTVFGVFSISLNTLSSQLALERKLRWSDYLKTTPLPSWMYLLAKLVTQFVLCTGVILVMYMTAFTVFGVRISFWNAILSALLVLAGSLAFQSLGLLIGFITKAEFAQTVSSLVYIVLSVLGGIFQPLELLPSLFQRIAFCLPTYQVAELTREVIAGRGPKGIHFILILAYTTLFFSLSVWRYKSSSAQK